MSPPGRKSSLRAHEGSDAKKIPRPLNFSNDRPNMSSLAMPSPLQQVQRVDDPAENRSALSTLMTTVPSGSFLMQEYHPFFQFFHRNDLILQDK